MAVDQPPVKRPRLEAAAVSPRNRHESSKLFAPYRTVGLISPTTVPFTTVPLGKTTFQITTSVGRSLQTYDLRRGLNLVFITRPETPGDITASKSWKDLVFAAWSNSVRAGVWAFKRGKLIAELEIPKAWNTPIKAICIFGSWIVGVGSKQMLVWKSTTLQLYTTLQSASPISLTECITSLPTFLNKILVGREDGSVEIWNVSSGKLVYTIWPPANSSGAVTVLEPTPALSLVAIAYQNGTLSIHDVRTDQSIMRFSVSASTPITSLSFRTDGLGAGEDGRQAGVMATASNKSGDVTLWDLNQGGRRVGVLRSAHADPSPSGRGGINRVEFLTGQSIFVTSSTDNSLKTWIFDESPFNPIPRILHSRAGHGAPLTKLLFLPCASDGSDDFGKWLLSSSHDRSLWAWSLRRDGQSTEVSQGAVQSKAKKQGILSANSRDSLAGLKCPPVTAMACSLNRDGGIGAMPGKQPIWKNDSKSRQPTAEVSGMTGWESVVTAHEDDIKARTWFWGRKRAGRWAFDTGDGGVVTSVATSPCGTFAIIGSAKGGIDMYNLQSGLHRQRYPPRLTPKQAKKLQQDLNEQVHSSLIDSKPKYYRGQGKHSSAVCGVAVDNLNSLVVSAGVNGTIKFWDFDSGTLIHQIDWSSETGIAHMRYHRESNLAAFTCLDGCVRVVDTTNYRLIRELWPSRDPHPYLAGKTFGDCSFSNDGRWIIACVEDIVLLWDLPTGHLIDAFKLLDRCTSIGFSPTGEYLATTTEGSVGIDVWSNRSMYLHVAAKHITHSNLARIIEGDALAPTVGGAVGTMMLNEPDEDDIGSGLTDGFNVDDMLQHVSDGLVSLSLVPRSRWQNLLHLDLIRQRNKPTEAPQKPEKAPFFLPSLQDQNSDVKALEASRAAASKDSEIGSSRFLKLNQVEERSRFTTALRLAQDTTEYEAFFEMFKTLTPASADTEIRSLSIEDDEMVAFVRALTWLMRSRIDFELGQAWMAVFLRMHNHLVVVQPELHEAVAEWRNALQQERNRLQALSGYVGGMVGWLRAARV